MRFGYTIFYVDDVKGAIDFYERAFGLRQKFVHEAGDYGELETGGTALAFASNALQRRMGKSPKAPESGSPSFEIALVTEDVPAALSQALAAGATLVQAAEETSWGQTVAYVADVNGFLVELCTPVG